MILYGLIRVLLLGFGVYCLIAGAPADACALFLLTISLELPLLRKTLSRS